MFEYLENFKLKHDIDNKPYNLSEGESSRSGPSQSGPSGSGASGLGASGSGPSGSGASGSGPSQSGPSQSGPSGSDKNPYPEHKSILDDARNYQYDSSDSDSFTAKAYYEWDQDDYNNNDRNSVAMGASPEQLKSILNKEDSVENIQNMKVDFKDAIELYKQGVSPEAEKQINFLKEKLDICDNKISELETESQSKGKGKASK